jgi:transcriptional regulator with PAS, ATPase and Fis domain
MSSAHARLVKALDRWIIEDAGSKNGTRVNGVARSRVQLVDGDVIEIGHTWFVFRDACGRGEPIDGAPAESLPDLPTFSPAFAARMLALAQVAPSEVSIVLLGETGTGKEVAARAVHAASRRPGPFVAVNCGAIPANLVEAELFGHRRGAFSGAVDDRPGLIRSAHRGTLLLDEIGDLPLPSQAALLRILQEREVVPVGETRPVTVDLRVIAATHHDLDALVSAGRFRLDLLARLSGLTITLPPLRDRREDLGLLIARLAPAGTTFTPAAARALFSYAWPLNIRELQQVLHAASVLASGSPVDLDHLPPSLHAPAPSARPLSSAVSRRHAQLIEVLRSERGNVAAVARTMKTTRAQIHRWAKKLGINLDSFR